MIKINKSINSPQVLIKKGIPEKTSNNTLYDSDPNAFQAGKKKIKIENSIYGHESVKEQLIAEQSGKCCFCEAKIPAISFGDVEHFRPKGGYRKKENDEIKKPGYYWKAYDWDNLFFSCQVCNTRYKKNYFPLEDENQRAKSHHDDINNENPLLIHPSQDDPEQHIGFRKDVCFHKDQKGKESISAYGINRKELVDIRREHLNNVKHHHDSVKLGEQFLKHQKEFGSLPNTSVEELTGWIEKAKQFLSRAATADAPFASIVRNKFPDLPR